MDPTSNYHKTKRILLVFVAALLLAIFAGLQLTNEHPTNEPSRVSVPTLQLKHPEFLKYILVVAVGFYLVQFSLQWAAQITEVQKKHISPMGFHHHCRHGGILDFLFWWQVC